MRVRYKKDFEEALKNLKKAQVKMDGAEILIDRTKSIISQAGSGNTVSIKTQRHPLLHAHYIWVVWNMSETATVSIDNLLSFELPFVSAHLFEVLAMDKGNAVPADHPYVPFKTYAEIRAEMSRRLDRPFSDHALKVAVYRLKLKLYDQNCETLVINSRRLKAYRLALFSRNRAVGAAAM